MQRTVKELAIMLRRDSSAALFARCGLGAVASAMHPTASHYISDFFGF